MYLAYVVWAPGFGGHTRSALAIAQSLARRGHQITFVASAAGSDELLRHAGFRVERIPDRLFGTCQRLERVFRELQRHRPLDAIHVFDTQVVAETVAVAKRLKVPAFHTICGGRPSPYCVNMESIFSVSEEVRDALVRRFSAAPGAIQVVRARLDVPAIRSQFAGFSPDVAAEFCRKYALAPGGHWVLRVARLHGAYERSVVEGAEAVGRLAAEGFDVRFVHIGHSQVEDVRRRVGRAIEAVNAGAGARIAVTAQDEGRDVLRYVPAASVTIGTGRAAFEGMLAERPTIIVGANGFAGLCERATIDDIAYYNFSGRNVPAPLPNATSVQRLADEIRRLIAHPDAARQAGSFARRYVEAELDVEKAADAYEARYASGGHAWPSNAEIWRVMARERGQRLRYKVLSVETRHWLLRRMRALRAPFQ